MPAATGGGATTPLNVVIKITTTGVSSAASGMGAVTSAASSMSRGLGTGVITARTMGDAMRMTASLMKYTVAGAFVKVGTAAIQAFRNFELSFSRIRGLVGMSADAVEKMKKGVLDMAVSTTRGPEELADALYFITSAGLRDSAVAMSVLESSAKAAAAGMGDTKTVADAVTSAMNAYGPSNLSAANATNILTAAVREGKAEADTFAPAFSKVLPVASAFGASFNDVAAAMAALTRSGMTAGTAGIYVRQVLSQLLKPSKQAQDALTAVGTSADQIRTAIKEKGMFQALADLSTKLGGTDEGAEKFAKVFGNVRALTAMLQLVGPAAEQNEEIFRRMQNTTGDLDHAFMTYSQTVDAEYNKSLAASRVALIKLGQTLKPFITSLLKVGRFFTTVSSAVLDFVGKLGPVGPIIGALVGGVTILVLALSAIGATVSSVIRIFGNFSVMLTGTSIQYDALTRTVYRYSAATAASGTATSATAAATGAATGATVAGTAATKAAALTAAGYVPVNFTLAGSLAAVRTAFQTLLGPIGWVMLGITALIAAWKFLPKLFSKFEDKTKTLADSMGKVNELLDQTVAYGQIKIGFNIKDSTEAASKLQADMERIQEQIKEQSPELMNSLREAGKANRQAMIAQVKALMEGQFANLGADTKKALLEVFQKDLNISDTEYANAVIGEVTGDSVTDALIQVGVSTAAESSKRITKSMQAIGSTSMSAYIQALQKEVKITTADGLDFTFNEQDVSDSLDRIGDSFVDFAQTSNGDITPVIIAMQELSNAGINNAATFDSIVGNALNGLSGNLELAKESTGNFYDIFTDEGNIASGALNTLVGSTAKLGDAQAANAVKAIQTELKKLPEGSRTAAASFDVFMSVIGKYMVRKEESIGLSEDQVRAFEAEAEAIRSTIQMYEEQINSMKALEDAQEALRGIAVNQEEALRNVYSSYKDIGEAVSESGGSLDIRTEGGSKAREELQKSAEAVFKYANALKQSDPEAAAQAVTVGLQNIVKTAAAAGGQGAGIDAAGFLEQLGFTVDNFVKSVTATTPAVDQEAFNTGKAMTDGVAAGIAAGQGTMSQALQTALQGVLISSQNFLKISSPSRVTENILGIPMMQGVVAGLEKEAKSNRTKGKVKNSLSQVLGGMMKTGSYQQVGKWMADFLKKKKDVETPAQDFVKATIGRMKDIIGSLGNYIKSQLSFRDAQSNLAKLINMQRSYDAQRARSAREVQYSETRFGAGGGAQVTGYEQAQIDQLQLDFERVSRDYAMGRATYVELVDAEISLYEARAAASEVNDEVISAQNDFIDKTVQQQNKTLELSEAIVAVNEAYLDQQEAAAELYINHKELESVYTQLSEATGIASGKIVIGTTDIANLGTEVGKIGGFTSTVGGYVSTLGNNVGVTGQAFNGNFFGPDGIFQKITDTGSNVKKLTTGIGADFTNLAKGLLNTDSQMYKDLQALGPHIFGAIQMAAQESLDASPLQLRISVKAIVDKSGSGSVSWSTNPDITPLPTTPTGLPGGTGVGGARGFTIYGRYGSPSISATTNKYANTYTPKAVGGAIGSLSPTLVGERGPEMFIPKVSGTIVTNNALQRYTRTRQNGAAQGAGANGNTISVVVNNPVPASAEDSITRRMKVLSNSGLFG